METIVLVLIGLCGGASLVLIATAWRSLQEKVSVDEYRNTKRDIDLKFDELGIQIERTSEDTNKTLEGLIEDLDRRIQYMERNMVSLELEISKVDSRIDSRVDKLTDKFEKELSK